MASSRSFSPALALALLCGAALPACGDKADAGDSGGGGTQGFCFDMADADTYEIVDGGPEGVSGLLDGRLITDESDDIRDPALVTNVDYTVENLDVGGSPLQGKTDSDGSFSEQLGAGTWRLRLSDSKGGYTCRNDIEVVIEAEKITRLCLDVGCE